MIRAFDAFSLPLLRWFDPEDAHRMAIQGLRLLPPTRPRPDDPKLAVRAFGLNFPNPVGMAAGFDKSAEAPDALLRLGFGFVEIGTVTPRPQVGNPRPRLFRLERDEAVINRMGFNNDGAEAVLRRLASRAHHGGIVGVNVGANKDSTGSRRRLRQADRNLCAGRELFHRQRLLAEHAGAAQPAAIRAARRSPGKGDRCPRARAEECRRFAGAAQDRARSQSRRTRRRRAHRALAPRRRHDRRQHHDRSRPSTLREQNRAREQGGLSGRPLFRLSTRMVAETYVRAEGAFPLVGVGGIDSGGAALTKIRAGASLIQLYSSLVYKGLGLVERHQERSRLDASPHRPRAAVGNRRRRCRDHHGRGLAGGVAVCRKRRLEQRRIAQRLQPAARRIVEQQRAPQAGIAVRAQRQPRRRERSPSDRTIRLRMSRAQVAPI